MIEWVLQPQVSVLALLWRVSAVLALGVLLTTVVRRRMPALAHALGVVSLLVALSSTLVAPLLPSWSAGIPATPRAGLESRPASGPVAKTKTAIDPVAATDSVTGPASPWSPDRALWMLWAIGTALGIGHLLLVLRRSQRAYSLSTPAPGRFQELAAVAASELGASDGITVRLCPMVRVPVLSGLRNPGVLLPSAAIDWTESRLLVVLRHELAHARRHDLVWLVLARMARIALWPQPLSWILERGIRVDCELACDELAVRSGVKRSLYGRELLMIASEMGGRSSFAPGIIPTGPAALERRIRQLISPALHTPRWLTLLLISLVALTGLGLASYGHPAAVTAQPWTLLGEDLTANRHSSLPAQRLQVVLFYDGKPSPAVAAEIEVTRRGSPAADWIVLSGIRKFDERIETREIQIHPGWSPTGRVRVRGVTPDGEIDGLAYGFTWRDESGAYQIVRSRDRRGSQSPNSICAWPLGLEPPMLATRTPQVTDPFGRDAARLAICGAQLVGNGIHTD